MDGVEGTRNVGKANRSKLGLGSQHITYLIVGWLTLSMLLMIACKRNEESEPITEIGAPPAVKEVKSVKTEFMSGLAFYQAVLPAVTITMFYLSPKGEMVNTDIKDIKTDQEGTYYLPVLGQDQKIIAKNTNNNSGSSEKQTAGSEIIANIILHVSAEVPESERALADRSIKLMQFAGDISTPRLMNINLFTTMAVEVARIDGLTSTNLQTAMNKVKSVFQFSGGVETLEPTDEKNEAFAKLIEQIAANANVSLNVVLKAIAEDIMDDKLDGRGSKGKIEVGAGKQYLSSYAKLFSKILQGRIPSDKKLAAIQVEKEKLVLKASSLAVSTAEIRVIEGQQASFKVHLSRNPKLLEVKLTIKEGVELISFESGTSLIFREDNYKEDQEVIFKALESNGVLTDQTAVIEVSGEKIEPHLITVFLSNNDIETPEIALFTNRITNEKSIRMTVASCEKYTHMFIREENQQPADSEEGWVKCDTNTGALTYVLQGDENKIRVVYIWGKTGEFISGQPASVELLYDAQPPTISSMDVIGGGENAISGLVRNTVVNVSLVAKDSLSKLVKFCIKFEKTAPKIDDRCFIDVGLDSVGMVASQQLNIVNYPYLLGFAPGLYSLFVWVLDEAGNLSALTKNSEGVNEGDGGIDMNSITYAPSSPARVVKFHAANTSSANYPPSADQKVFGESATPGVGSTVYIKWYLTDDFPLTDDAISLYYTQDNVNYTLIEKDLEDGINSGCTVNSDLVTPEQYMSGCFRWLNRPVITGYFALRIVVKDSFGNITYEMSDPLNTPKVNILAGTTETGLNASAARAVFFNETRDPRIGDPGSFVVATNGNIYFRDIYRGIMSISPADGIAKILIPTTGVATGDGGSIVDASGQFIASLKHPIKIALDNLDRLVIWDFDRIRVIDTTITPMLINSIIGGGDGISDPPGTTTPLEPSKVNLQYPVSALDLSDYSNIDAVIAPFIVLPNGNILFRSENYFGESRNGARMRIYKVSEGKVNSISPSGSGSYAEPLKMIGACRFRQWGVTYSPKSSLITSFQLMFEGENNSDCPGDSYVDHASFDPDTGIVKPTFSPHMSLIEPGDPRVSQLASRVVGKNGELYAFSREKGRLYHFDAATNGWDIVAGTGVRGVCEDMTAVLDCSMEPVDMFVSQYGQIYFVDRGKFRVIDGTNKVTTMLGAGFNEGDGESAISARFNDIPHIEKYEITDEVPIITVFDQKEHRIRSFPIGGKISLVAGNGDDAVPHLSTEEGATSVKFEPLQTTADTYYFSHFGVHPVDGKLLNSVGSTYIAQLDSASWVHLVGQTGGFEYKNADGKVGTTIDLNANIPEVLGVGTASFLVAIRSLSGKNVMLKEYTLTEGTQSQFAGSSSDFATGNMCDENSGQGDCVLPNGVDAKYTKAVFDTKDGKWYFSLVGEDGVWIKSQSNTMIKFDFPRAIRSFTLLHTDSLDLFFYCSMEGNLYKWDRAPTTPVETPLPWPADLLGALECTGQSMVYSAESNSIIFPFTRNHMMGVAQYLLD